MLLTPQNLLTNYPYRISFYLKNPQFQNPIQFSPNSPNTLFNFPQKIHTLKPQSPFKPPIRAFESSRANIQENQEKNGSALEFDALLSVAEFLCLASSAVIAFGMIVNTQKPILVWLGNKLAVWQFVLLVGGMAIGATIRRRQWSRICVDHSKPGRNGANLVDRIEKLEEEFRSSVTIVRVMSRQLEKLGIRFRVTRKALKEPIAETAALAQKNSEATRALAAQKDILERELGEIQKVLLAMQEQQQKQLELILAIAKNGKLWESKREPSRDQTKVDKRNSTTEGVKQISPNQIQSLTGQKEISNDKV